MMAESYTTDRETIALAYTSIANSGDRWVIFAIPGEPIRYRYFAHGEEQERCPLSRRTRVQYVSDRDFDDLASALGLPHLNDWPHLPEEAT